MKSLGDLISWIPSPWSHPTSHPSSPTQPHCYLETLPLEILYMITESLDPVAKTCLSLCNHHFYTLFGQKRPFRTRTEAWHTFHTILAHDNPSLIYCRVCTHFHRRQDISPPGPAWQTNVTFPRHSTEPAMRSLQSCLAVHQTGSLALYQLNYMHVQLAMKRHHCGREHGIAVDDLAHVEVLAVPARGLTSLLSVEAQVGVAPSGRPSLCLRMQNWVLMREFRIQRLPFVRVCGHGSLHAPDVCAVIQRGVEACMWRGFEAREAVMEMDGGVQEEVKTENENENENENEDRAPQTFHCPPCDTTYQVEVRACGDEGVAVVMTKWLDLGAGLDPRDHDWRRHLFFERHEMREVVLPPEESVRARFERAGAVALEDLTRQNSSLLEGRAYTRKMDHWFEHVWVLQGNKRLPIYCYLPPKKNVLASQVRLRS